MKFLKVHCSICKKEYKLMQFEVDAFNNQNEPQEGKRTITRFDSQMLNFMFCCKKDNK